MTAPRIYDSLLAGHLASNRQMAFFSGPRQVGKTTTCRLRADAYVNWDDIDDRELILPGPRNLVGGLGLDRLSETVPVVLFDELHKFPRWKQFKAVEGWNDAGFGAFGLGYLRDKEKREVDFLVVRDGAPWLLAEVKHRDGPPSPSLRRYQDQVGAPFAFQVTMDADYVDEDCFAGPGGPLIVPARTLLSQLL